MDKETFRAMLEKRGYGFGIEFVEQNGAVEVCTVGDHEATDELLFRKGSFERMTYEAARDYIDDQLAEGMRHVVHSCGQVLLEANGWWSGMGPYNDFQWGFYEVPLHWGSKPVSRCPTCGEKLDLEGDEDNEEELDLEEFEEMRPTVLPRVTD